MHMWLLSSYRWLLLFSRPGVSHSATPWTATHQASLSLTISQSLPKFMSIALVMPSISSSDTLFSFCPQSFPASGTFPVSPLFTSDDQNIGVQLQHSPSYEYSGLISLKIDWFDLLTVRGTLRSLLQHHSSKASILWCSAFLMVQLSQPYVTTGKTIALTIWTFVGRVISLFSTHCLGLL